MKKIIIAVITILFSSITIAQAISKDNDIWYLGARLGWSHFHDSNWYDRALNNDGSIHKNQLGTAIFGSYQINPHIGFEMGYDWLGYLPYKGNIINGTFKAQGIQLTAKINYPITDYFGVYARFGSVIWHVNSNNSISGSNQDTGLSPVFSGGIEWTVTYNIITRLEYQWINNIGNGNTVGVCPDNGMLNIGISYQFRQQKTVTPAIVAASSQEVQTKYPTLKSDVLFSFNKATLELNSQQVLDRLCDQLKNINLKDDSIIVLGFTDRIGSDHYNKSLSEKRALSVVDYLIFRGIHNVKISAYGMGKYNPVTGNNCNNIKISDSLINCLAPDRRVEIKVKGIKDIAV